MPDNKSTDSDNAASVSFDAIAGRYDATRTYPPAVAARIAAGLLAAGDVAPGGHVLELGIGTGRIALPLLAAGVNVTGVDIASRMVERLHAKYVEQRTRLPALPWGALRVELADMTALPFDDGSFDATVGVHILHLVPGWRTALSEALRVVRPGGAFLLGQDTTEEVARNQINDEWAAIVAALGYQVTPVGAAGFGNAVDELRARGVRVEQRVLARWQEQRTPAEALAFITERVWSRTWPVPDALFAESARQLTAWARRTFGETLHTPRTARLAFKVAIARRN
ncbi:MAG: class I SAM-dependent methyltransferase [Ktedonobacterales bacterium]